MKISIPYRKRKYSVNENYFLKWSSNMAYILGFLSADGNIYKSTISIELQERDEEILNFIRNEISPETIITQTKKKDKCYLRLRINSRTIVNALAIYGIIPKKSFILDLGFKIPKEFLGDYIRGVFDGDGTVNLRRNSIECEIYSANRKYLEQIQKLIGIGRLSIKRSKNKRDYYRICFSKSASLKLAELMYKKENFNLKRKKEKFNQFIQYDSARRKLA